MSTTVKCAPLSGGITKAVGSIAKRLLYGSAAVLVVTGAASYAQDEENSASLIEEVVVLAQKREQNLQDVPASVAVITGEDMAAVGASSGIDILKLTPAVTLYGDQDPRTTHFSIRGISSPFLRSAIEPSASIIIDGETLPRSSALNMDLMDVERVEILRGPQGTLFGKNVSAGALHIITKRPSLDGFGGNMNVTVAEDDEYVTRGSVNTLLNDRAALRLNGYWRDMGGWVPNLNSAEPDGGQKEGWGARLQLLFELSDRLEVLGKVEVSKEDYGPYAKAMTGIPADDLLGEETRYALWLSGDYGNIGPNNRTTSQIGDRDYGDLDNLAFSLEGRYSADAFDVIYVGSYRDWELYTNEDQTLIAVNASPCYFCGDTNIETVQQEIRLESNADGPVSYTVGLFYNRQEIFRSERWTDCIKYGPPFGLPAGTVIDPQTFNITDCGGIGSPVSRDDAFLSSLEINNYAAFTNIEWRLNDSINLFAGARVLYEEQELTHEVLPSDKPVALPGAGTPPFTVDTEDTAVIGRVGGQYFFDDNTMLYASFATGYKGKAWDNWFSARSFLEDNFPVAAEKPMQLEVGLKGDFFHDRARVNLTLFRTDIKDHQDVAQLPDPHGPRGEAGGIRRLQNAGKVRTQGAELEVIVLAHESLVLSGSFNWIDATYKDDAYSGCTSIAQAEGICELVEYLTIAGTNEPQLLVNRKGEQFANSVDFSYVLSADYRLDDLPGGYAGSAKLTYRWLDNQEFAFKHPYQRRDDYGVANLSLRLAAPQDRWALTFFINNLFDEDYHERSTGNYVVGWAAPFGGFAQTLARDYKRYVGANLNVNF